MKCPRLGCKGRLRVKRSNCSIPGEHRRLRECPICGFSARSEEILSSDSPLATADAIRAGILMDLIAHPRISVRELAAKWNCRIAAVKRYRRSLEDARRIVVAGAFDNPASALETTPNAVIKPRKAKPQGSVLDLTNASPGE